MDSKAIMAEELRKAYSPLNQLMGGFTGLLIGLILAVAMYLRPSTNTWVDYFYYVTPGIPMVFFLVGSAAYTATWTVILFVRWRSRNHS